MKQIYLYNETDFELLNCQLMGVNSDGSPQVIITSPGTPVMTLEDHQEFNLYDETCYFYLGEPGDTISEKEIIKMFAGYLLMAENYHEDLSELMKSLKLAGIKWSDEFQKLIFEINARKDTDGNDVLCLYIFLAGDEKRYMAHTSRYKSLRQILDRISRVMFEITCRADIPAACDLCISEELKNELSCSDQAFFDNIQFI